MTYGRCDLTEYEWRVIERFCRTSRVVFQEFMIGAC